ncbi:hypothetical protein FOCC_FOCC014684 [Frankliniella occidentalis]|nr:hypothetical protein FOCC_FOCC014684 [Frankliniella occidentalis]
MYVFHREKKDGTGWRCDQRGKCLGRMTVLPNDTVLDEKPHSHPPDWGSCTAQETVQAIKRAAETSRATTVAVVQSKIARVSDKTAMKLPKFRNLKKMVRRVKRRDLPPEPKELMDLEEIPRQFRTTLKGDRWLLHFDPEEDQRVIIFTTDKHLRLLARATYWVMDGTFKVAPHIICQVYAIHAAINGKWVPLVVVLMERKTRRAYDDVFEILKTETRRRVRRELAPEKVSTDYEQSAIQAVRAAFPDAEVAGCLFHFGQAQWRRLQEAGLAVAYREEQNEAMRTDFIALAFVPLDDVEDAFDALSEAAVLILRPIFQHVEETYLRGRLRARRGARVRRRGPPLFPPHLWNCYERTVEGLPRTTNPCEAWHRRLLSLIGKHHPSTAAIAKKRNSYLSEKSNRFLPWGFLQNYSRYPKSETSIVFCTPKLI